MSYIDHARRELNAIGYKLDGPLEDGPNKWTMENLFELLEVFGKQGHSGSSAPMIAGMFKKLALFEPLGPLTGKDDEWQEVAEGMWQNIRCSHVFKDANGKAYDGEGVIFQDPDGLCYTNSDSRVYISFPYTPERRYVRRTPQG
jgi:hypothetical protein